MLGKATYLKKLYAMTTFRPLVLSEHIEGSSPPSVFVGSWNYPKVHIGPLITQQFGDTSFLDSPEDWLKGNKPEDIVNFRLQLIRGKQAVTVKDQSKTVEMMRDIALAKSSVDIEANFSKIPRGHFLHEEVQPFGPSAPLKDMKVGEAKYEHRIEKAHHDTDLLANDAVLELYNHDVVVSKIQKAFSVGAFGLQRNRKLVPTRWSITAVDDIISKDLLANIRTYPLIDSYRVYEFNSFNNYFSILLMPQQWRYEFLEAFLRVLGSEEVIFSDWEPHEGKKGYTTMGGCYYSVRLAVAEQLKKEKKQAAVLAFRESYKGYIPLGVWLIRQCVREAMKTRPKEFPAAKDALNYILNKLYLPYWKYRRNSTLLKALA